MILGLGVDLFDVGRLKREIDRHGPRFLDSVLSPAEQCGPRGRRHALAVLAGCFAAKEALFKALGTGVTGEISWLQVEIDTPDGMFPQARPSGAARRAIEQAGVQRIHISISRGRRWALAAVVLEGPTSGSLLTEET